jgi:1-acyl-sn-glycerol-3-phosphate acyltransferase
MSVSLPRRLLTALLAVMRRAVTVPTVITLDVLLLVAAPVLLAAAAVLTPLARSTRPLRTVALVVAYAFIELSVLSRLLSGEELDWDDLLREVLAHGYRAMELVLDVRVVVEGGSAEVEQLQGSGGIVVLARHCGPGDSLFIAWLLAVRYRLRLRVVLTALLCLEPTVDLAGDHLPLCFIGHSRRRARGCVEDVARSMSAGDALLLFPEGGNFSWPRWRRSLSELSASGAYRRVRRARRNTYTLPPRLGGAMAALAGAPTADVLLLAHSGFAEDGRDRPLWRLPTHRDLLVRTELVPAAEVPRGDDEAMSAWLDRAWSQIDRWVENRVEPDDAPVPSPPLTSSP